MNAETLFSVCNFVALAGWVLLIFLPRWRWTGRLVLSGAVSLALSAVYLVLIILFFGRGEGGFGSLADVARLFQEPFVLLAGWVHYLAFDLFVGAWEVRDGRRRGVPHLLLIPCLLLTFFLGPVGFAAYHALRLAWKKRSPGATEA